MVKEILSKEANVGAETCRTEGAMWVSGGRAFQAEIHSRAGAKVLRLVHDALVGTAKRPVQLEQRREQRAEMGAQAGLRGAGRPL